jgi:hypothetical protein
MPCVNLRTTVQLYILQSGADLVYVRPSLQNKRHHPLLNYSSLLKSTVNLTVAEHAT